MAWLFKYNRPYIKEDQKELVRAHKYVGQELSITYNYFYAPLCNIIVEYLPMWLAPNIISFMGFLANFIPHIMIPIFWGCDFDDPVPNWFCYFLGKILYTFSIFYKYSIAKKCVFLIS
jgi:ethanolaminephosphotransferase